MFSQSSIKLRSGNWQNATAHLRPVRLCCEPRHATFMDLVRQLRVLLVGHQPTTFAAGGLGFGDIPIRSNFRKVPLTLFP